MRKWINSAEALNENARRKLSDVARISTNMEDADFWIIRRGSGEMVGKPTKTFNPEHIGVKVTATDVLVPQYLYYAMVHLHNQGVWKGKATGSLNLVNIKVEDVRNTPLG